ncbi:MAG: phosphatase [Cyclobacteriaceae bacterium]
MDRGPKALFKKLEYIRFPLRLGHDVFTTGKISKESIAKFMKLMKAYKLMIELYEADDYMFCATSAMRESDNGKELAERVYSELGLQINLISGKEEADLINRAIRSYLTDHTYLHIDVGGGSTELNIYVHGKKMKTRSFKIGSVRVLEHNDQPVMWTDMEKWIKSNMKKSYGRVTAVGTGGNISKIFELAGKKPGKTIGIKTVKEVKSRIEKLTMDQRIYELQMNPDRADVIVPASDVYLKVMEWAHAQSILVPDVGLKDGMLLYLLEKNQKQRKIEF